MNFRPTVIIGIGTSGGKIIKGTRELFFEEFQTYDLPSVQFIHITSDNSLDAANSVLTAGNFSSLNEIKINFDNQTFARIPGIFKQGSPQNDSEISSWCDPDVQNNPAASLRDGLQNDRQFGRLALWMRWNDVRQEIDRVINIVNSQYNLNNTQHILDQYCQRRNLIDDINIETNCNVYIVGSIHGGTCSGTFLDIAQYLKTKVDLELVGILTMMGSPLARERNAAIVASNGFGALLELDYYTQKDSDYNYRLPATANINKNQNPFDGVYFVSTHDENGTPYAIADSNGNLDLESLHQMVSIPLFFNVLGFDNESGLFKANQGGRLETYKTDNTYKWNLEYPYIKFFTSYSSKAVWYPKNRITALAAVNFIKDRLLVKIVGEHSRVDSNTAQVEASRILSDIKQKILKEMRVIGGDGKTTIQDDMLPFFNKLNSFRSDTGIHIDDFKHALMNEPVDERAVSRFKIQGKYERLISRRMNLFKTEFIDSLNQTFNKLYEESLTNTDGRIGNSLFFIDGIRNELLNIIKQNTNTSKVSSSDENFSDIDANFQAIEIEQKRISTMMVGVRPVVIRQHFDNLTEVIKNQFNNLENTLLEYCYSELLKAIDSEISNSLRDKGGDYRQKTDKLTKILINTESELNNLKEYTTLDIIFKNYITKSNNSYDREASFKADIQEVMEKIDEAAISAELIQILNDFYSLQIQNDSIGLKTVSRLIEAVQKHLLMHRDLVDINIENFQYFRNGVNKSKLANILPMMELDGYRGNALPPTQATNFICGLTNDVNRQNMMVQLNEQIGGQAQKFDKAINVNLPHILYVHKEKPDISIDETLTFHAMKQQAIQTNRNSMFLDKHGKSKVDVRLVMIKKALEKHKLTRIILEIFSDMGVFVPDANHIGIYIFNYVDQFNRQRSLKFHPNQNNLRDESFELNLLRDKTALKSFLHHLKYIAELNDDMIMMRITDQLQKIREDDTISEVDRNEKLEFYSDLDANPNIGNANALPKILIILNDFKHINIDNLDW